MKARILATISALSLTIGVFWMINDQAVDHSPPVAFDMSRNSQAGSSSTARAGSNEHGGVAALCATAANPFGGGDGCVSVAPNAKVLEESGLKRPEHARGEDVVHALKEAEKGSAHALSSYVDLRARCLEQSFEAEPVVCFTSEGLAALDSRFLQSAAQAAGSGSADAQLALLRWWRLRAYQLLDSDPASSPPQWDEPEESLVTRMMGNSQFADAMRKSLGMYENLAANDPAKLEGTGFLEEYRRYGLVPTHSTP